MTESPESRSHIVKTRGRFRKNAQAFVESARGILDSGDNGQLDVVAMRLRKAFECLTYEYATIYLDELTDGDLAIWQPRKLMDRLLELDPLVGIDLELSIQNDETGEWISLGKQSSLNLTDIKKSYGSLSRLIHHASLQQILDATHENSVAARQVCENAALRLKRVLSSTLWNVALPTAGIFSFNCTACGAGVKRRLTALRAGPHEAKTAITADCPKCPASFDVELSGENEVAWCEKALTVTCPDKECSKPFEVWPRQLREGETLQCPKCLKLAKIMRLWVLAKRLN